MSTLVQTTYSTPANFASNNPGGTLHIPSSPYVIVQDSSPGFLGKLLIRSTATPPWQIMVIDSANPSTMSDRQIVGVFSSDIELNWPMGQGLVIIAVGGPSQTPDLSLTYTIYSKTYSPFP